MTYAADIEAAAGGEPVLFAVVGDMGRPDYGDDERHAPGLSCRDQLLPWSVVRGLLDYEYDPSFGAPDCQSVYAWTASRVIYTWQYDGHTGQAWVPRDPTAGPATMPGG